MSSKTVLQWRGTEDDFMKSCHIFRQKSGQFEQNLDSLRSHLPLAITAVLDKQNLQDGVNILSIGSGEGDMDVEILKIINNEIQRKHPSVEAKMFNRAVEPQVSAINLYKNAVASSLPRELSKAQVLFDIGQPRSFEEYMSEVNERAVKFDIIHFIHSLYHIHDTEAALKHCYEKELANNGIIVLILDSKGDTLELIKQRIFAIDHLGSEIGEIARKNGWNHQVYTQEFLTDVSEVFDEQSVDGNLLLDFYVHSNNFRFNDKPETVKLALELIKEKSILKNGKVLARKSDDTHFIFKC